MRVFSSVLVLKEWSFDYEPQLLPTCRRRPSFLFDPPILAMIFTAGMRVYLWDSKGTLIRGVVVTVATTGDHSKMLTIKVDGSGAQVTLPAEGVTKE